MYSNALVPFSAQHLLCAQSNTPAFFSLADQRTSNGC
jgi:hypothetical protein